MRGTSLQEENLNSCLQEGVEINSVQSQNPSIALLRSWLNKTLKIGMSDGRILVGTFLCTDREGNIIIGSCQEFLKNEDGTSVDEPRILGLVMVPGRHIVQMHLDLIKS